MQLCKQIQITIILDNSFNPEFKKLLICSMVTTNPYEELRKLLVKYFKFSENSKFFEKGAPP